jgi:hypothetical protein
MINGTSFLYIIVLVNHPVVGVHGISFMDRSSYAQEKKFIFHTHDDHEPAEKSGKTRAPKTVVPHPLFLSYPGPGMHPPDVQLKAGAFSRLTCFLYGYAGDGEDYLNQKKTIP